MGNTTLNAVRTRKALWEVVQGYLTRWRVEDTIRFIKQSYRLEHMRLLDFRRLGNMAALVVAVAYFAECPREECGDLQMEFELLTG